MRLGLAMLRTYLALFAAVAGDPAHARREHSLIEGSLRESYAASRNAGRARLAAAQRAVRDHLAELSPLTLLRKTRSDAAFAPEPRKASPWPELAVLTFGALLIAAVWRSAADSSSVTTALAAWFAVMVTAYLLCVVGAVRRGVSGPTLTLAIAATTWPLWRWRVPSLEEGIVAPGILAALLIALTIRRHGRGVLPGLLLIASAPIVLLLSHELPRMEVRTSPAEALALVPVVALVLHLTLATMGLRRIAGRPRSTPPASEVIA